MENQQPKQFKGVTGDQEMIIGFMGDITHVKDPELGWCELVPPGAFNQTLVPVDRE